MARLQRVALLGGDDRQVYLANILCRNQQDVMVFGLEDDRLVSGVSQSECFEQGLEREIIILPVPVTRDGEHIMATCHQEELQISKLAGLLTQKHILFGGNIPRELSGQCGCFYDFMKIEEIALRNGVATAEGALAEAIARSPENLYGSECLVLGYGRCAKILADRLKGLGASVTVAARSAEQLAQAEVMGYQGVFLEALIPYLHRYRFVFNTIPANILTEQWVERLSEGTTVIDIASSPGGTDLEACRKRGIEAALCPGLPGRYAPAASAKILAEAVLSRIL